MSAKVKVEQGWLEGEVVDLVTGDGQYYSFKGVPYAAPPLGTLRFKAPQPLKAWDGVRQAKEHGPVCTQVDVFTKEAIPGSEDCLYLNVYTPRLNSPTPLPVMFFIHGGGYQSGSGNDDNYGPDFLVNHGVVLVTINYRLDALGFLCLDTPEVPGNAGMKDQVAALKWVNANIANFGGDPNNITVFGESAGGASTAFHILSPMSKGLFKKAIAMSGVPLCDWSVAYQPRKRAFILGKMLGKETTDANELLEFLQSVPDVDLIAKNTTILAAEEITNPIIKMFNFNPVVEKDFGQEHFLLENPLDILRKSSINEVDLLLGHTTEEGVIICKGVENLITAYNRYSEMLVPRKILTKCTPDVVLEIADKIHSYYFGNKSINLQNVRNFISMVNDTTFIYDIQRFMMHFPKKNNGKKFLYQFSCRSDRNVYGHQGAKYGIIGASHLDDLMYLFDAKRYNMAIDKNSREYKLIQLSCAVFTNFAKYGTPTPDCSLGVTWPEYDNEDQHYADIGDTIQIRTKPHADTMDFWKSIYDYAGLEF